MKQVLALIVTACGVALLFVAGWQAIAGNPRPGWLVSSFSLVALGNLIGGRR